MICPHCGNQLPKKGQFCVFCGEKIDFSKTEEMKQQDAAVENRQVDEAARDSREEKIVAVAENRLAPENTEMSSEKERTMVSGLGNGEHTLVIPPLGEAMSKAEDAANDADDLKIAETAEDLENLVAEGRAVVADEAEKTDLTAGVKVAEESELTETAVGAEIAEVIPAVEDSKNADMPMSGETVENADLTATAEATESANTTAVNETAEIAGMTVSGERAAVADTQDLSELMAEKKASRKRRRRSRGKKNTTQVFPKVDTSTTQVMPAKEELAEEAASQEAMAVAEEVSVEERNAYFEAEADAILRQLDGEVEEDAVRDEDIAKEEETDTGTVEAAEDIAEMEAVENVFSETADDKESTEAGDAVSRQSQSAASGKNKRRKQRQKARKAAAAAAAAATATAEAVTATAESGAEEAADALADPLRNKDSFEYMTNTYDLDVDVDALFDEENIDEEEKNERYERLVVEDKRTQARHQKIRYRQRNQRMILTGIASAVIVLAIVLVASLVRYNKVKNYERAEVASVSADSVATAVTPTATPTPKATATPTPTPTATPTPTPEATPEPTAEPTPTPEPTPEPEEEEEQQEEEVYEEDDEEETYYDNSYVIPNSSSEYLSDDDVNWMSSGDLRLARNEIYARHGQTFQSDDLQAYFDSQEWYTPLYAPGSLTFNDLSAVERANIQLIQSYE